MSERYRFFGSAAGDVRQYTQVEFAEVLARVLTTGYIPNMGAELKVTQTDPPRLAVKVGVGEAWMNGYWYQNSLHKEINLSPANPTYPRIDMVVVKLDVIGARTVEAVVKTGVPAPTPVAPSLEQTTQIWEIPLAEVRVAAGATSVSNTNITDKRVDIAIPRNAASQAAFNAHLVDYEQKAIKTTGDWKMAGSLEVDGGSNYRSIRQTRLNTVGVPHTLEIAMDTSGNASLSRLANAVANGQIRIDSAERIYINAMQIINGTGSPEGVVIANIGALYTNKSGGASATLWVKESGTGNVGWKAK